MSDAMQAGVPATIAAPSAPAGEVRPRLLYVDGVRAAAALYVVLHHIWLTTYPAFPVNSGPSWVGWMIYGHLAVAVFIVVSGFSLSLQPVRHDHELTGGVRTFLRRRAWRILPTYWAAILLSVVVYAIFTGDKSTPPQVISLKGVVVHALLLQDLVHSPAVNGAFWSIAIEWQIYFLFPLLLWVRRRHGAAAVVGAATAAVVVAYELSLYVDPLHRIQNVVPQFLALFTFGMLAAEVTKRVESRVPWALVAGASGLWLLVVIVTMGSRDVAEHFFWIDLAVGAWTALVLAGLADSRPRRARSILGGRVLHGIGQYSYSIYCVHLPILSLVWWYLIEPTGFGIDAKFVLLLVAGVPAVVAGAFVFSRVFEQPFLGARSFASVRAYWRDRRPRAEPVSAAK